MKILITGGTGFIGSALALKCLSEGSKVVALGREQATPVEVSNSNRIRAAGGEVGTALIDNQGQLEVAMKDTDVVFHLAAAQHEMNISDEVFEAVNIEGTRKVLDAAVNQGVKRFIHGSTIGVYGRDTDSVVDEETPLRPDNIYGQTKAEGEAVVRQYFDRLSSTIIRISETYGPGDQRLLKLFRAIKKRAFFMIGNGLNLHQLIYIDDLTDGLLLAARTDRCQGETIILAGRERLSSNEMASYIAEAVGAKMRSLHAPLFIFMLAASVMEYTLRPIGIQPPIHKRSMDFFTKSFCINTNKAESILNFSPGVDFRSGAQKTFEWYRDQKLL